MSVADPSGPVPPHPSAPRSSRWANLPWVWAVPVVALLIGGWLGVNALIERGPTIRISFATGDGIDAGRTTIQYKNVVLGKVVRVGLSRDHTRVVATAEMTGEAEPLLRAETRFWVVRPQVGFSGISGLGTLVSGPYIGLLPGQGAAGTREFTGLERAPPEQGLVRGQEYVLVADQLHGLRDGAPAYYHGVQIGEVIGHELFDEKGTVNLHLFVYEPHPVLIHPGSQFWISAGFQIAVTAQGLQVGTESLQTLLTGGIVLETPAEALGEPPSRPGTTFRLYPNEKAAEDAGAGARVSYRLYFPGSQSGLAVDTPVQLRGLPIGRVAAVAIEFDAAADRLRVPVTIEIAPQRITLPGQGAIADAAALNGMFERLIAKGLRARLDSGNLLTGSRVVELDFVDNAEPAQFVRASPYPEFPTVAGSGMAEMTASASRFLDKLAALPLGEMIADVRNMVRHADSVVASPALKRSLQSLDQTLANAERLTREAQQQIGPLLAKLNTASDQLNGTLALLGNDPRSSTDLAHTLAELKSAAQSVRALADYLERHPEALIAGKPQQAVRR